MIVSRELAQLVERHPYKVDVAGSNPVLPTKSDNLQLFATQIMNSRAGVSREGMGASVGGQIDDVAVCFW